MADAFGHGEGFLPQFRGLLFDVEDAGYSTHNVLMVYKEAPAPISFPGMRRASFGCNLLVFKFANDRWRVSAGLRCPANDRWQGSVGLRRAPNDRWRGSVGLRRSPNNRWQGSVGLRRSPNDRWQGSVGLRRVPNDRWRGFVNPLSVIRLFMSILSNIL